MSKRLLEREYDQSKVEGTFDRAPMCAANQVFGASALVGTPAYSIRHYAVISTGGIQKQIYSLGDYAGHDASARLAKSFADFPVLLTSLAGQLDPVLAHADDPEAFEYHALLYWPACDSLRGYLGMDAHGDELIVACDILRAQFRERPVTVAALRALREVFVLAARPQPLDAETVDHCLDLLEAAGVDQSFPLAFADGPNV